MSSDPVAKFISRWSDASDAERANYAMFLSEMCDVLDVARPEPATDDTVADAYGWPWPLTDAEILERVVALNAQRAKEEAEGKIRWLRPEYQLSAVSGAATKQSTLELADATDSKSVASNDRCFRNARVAGKATKPKKIAWPRTMAERAKAVESALAAAETPQTAAQLAKQFLRAKPKDVEEILQTLVALSKAHESDTKGTYVR